MPFFIIKGTFHVLGYSPDGDSIRFQADDEANWAKLSGPPVTLNARRHAQLRLEAIDTLETHYRNVQQPIDLATSSSAATSTSRKLLWPSNNLARPENSL